MLGIITVIQDDCKAVFVELQEPANFKMGEQVNISKAKKIRSLKQNALYWVFLTWLINPFGGDLQSQGHFSVDSLHDNIKEWIKMTHPHQFNVDKKFSTAELSKKDFGLFFDLVKQELFTEILGVDILGFEKDYEKYSSWSQYSTGDMNEFLLERMPF